MSKINLVHPSQLVFHNLFGNCFICIFVIDLYIRR